MIKDLEHGLIYNFCTGGEGKSGIYFTHLFVDMIKKELDLKYHSLGYVGNMGKNVIVDDASYSGEQILKNMARFGEGDGDLYIILVAASEEAVHKIRHHRPKRYKINVPIAEMFTLIPSR
jgi:chloramphenicol 3-O-phosphotransferase